MIRLSNTHPFRPRRAGLHCLALLGLVSSSPMWLPTPPLAAQSGAASITEERRVLETYPYSSPNAVPMLASDTRLYPYHRFEGYAHDSEPREWTVVHLENEYIEVWVLPEIGGKVWGARVKETGHEFIYRNEVVKFRNIALRGPWTSGGIEFNFGVIGHTPATATPVDYLTRENDDGSVSVFVGTTDLPSRTRWRIEVRLPADAAYFETNVLWSNPTPLEQPYYNWMTAAAFAQDDLVMSIPGNAYLEHPGARRSWPFDELGRDQSVYDENRFGSNKSFHVVGELEDFFGGYYLEDDYGFGHWARYEEMPGQKLWLWALSRQGGIWEDLLTDTDGQYVEFQAGRLLVQYSPGADVNPISQVGFDPGATDRWTETWFPVEALGGLSDASRDGAMFVERSGDLVTVRAHAFRAIDDEVRFSVDGSRGVSMGPLAFDVLEPVALEFRAPATASVSVELPALGLRYESDPSVRALARPFVTDDDAMPSIPEAVRAVMAADELAQGRRFPEARAIYEDVVAEEPWNREALLGLADLQYRRGLYAEGLRLADRALRLDAYDSEANFMAGNLHRALGHLVDAREAFGWAARSMAFRSAAYVQLAELAFVDGDYSEAERYARLATDYDHYSLPAYEVLAIVGRVTSDRDLTSEARSRLLEIDPLHHFVRAEHYLDERAGSAGRAFTQALRSEYPEQEVLELAARYRALGLASDAAEVVRVGGTAFPHPLLRLWHASLTGDDAEYRGAVDPAFVFPFRAESLAVLSEAAEVESHWSISYLRALNLWALDRADEAIDVLVSLGDRPDFAPFYVTRAHLSDGRTDRVADLHRAVAVSPNDRAAHMSLIQRLQDEGQWEDALAASWDARRRLPGDFDLDLLHTRALNETMRYEESIAILDEIAVLPSEHASTSHGLFADAHTMAALDAMERERWDDAARHLETAMTWPERLGLGRPYDPEERLQRFLLARVHAARGDESAARRELARVIVATGAAVLNGTATEIVRADLMGALAAAGEGQGRRLDRFGFGAEGALGRLAAVVREASERDDVQAALAEAARREFELFGDVEGRLIYRALAEGR